MQNIAPKIERVEIGDELRVCPSCGYELGFHISLVADGEGNRHRVILICPSCGARYDVGKRI
jgi:hypothetical protein